jgi:hypothetical protein
MPTPELETTTAGDSDDHPTLAAASNHFEAVALLSL